MFFFFVRLKFYCFIFNVFWLMICKLRKQSVLPNGGLTLCVLAGANNEKNGKTSFISRYLTHIQILCSNNYILWVAIQLYLGDDSTVAAHNIIFLFTFISSNKMKIQTFSRLEICTIAAAKKNQEYKIPLIHFYSFIIN